MLTHRPQTNLFILMSYTKLYGLIGNPCVYNKLTQRGLCYSQFLNKDIYSFGRNGECFAPHKKEEALPASGGLDE